MSRGRLERAFRSLLAGLAWAGALLLLAMMLVIVGDVALRNVAVPGLPRGLAWSNEVSELMLYLVTMCLAPWLLRQGQHIRVDVLLQALPRRTAWLLEWAGDMLGLACCLVMTWYGARGLREPCGGRRQHQDAGHAGVVVAGAAARRLRAAVHRDAVAHGAPACRPAGAAPRRGERGVSAARPPEGARPLCLRRGEAQHEVRSLREVAL